MTQPKNDLIRAIDAVLCFGCGEDTDNIFGDGSCSYSCRRLRERAITGLGLAIRRFVRRAEVARLEQDVNHLAACISAATSHGVGVFAGQLRQKVGRLAALAMEGAE